MPTNQDDDKTGSQSVQTIDAMVKESNKNLDYLVEYYESREDFDDIPIFEFIKETIKTMHQHIKK